MKEKLPTTILYPEKFKQSLAAGFDGCFDWSWTDGCFGKTRIKPMDFDGVVERKGNLLVFESKDLGIKVIFNSLLKVVADTLVSLNNFPLSFFSTSISFSIKFKDGST